MPPWSPAKAKVQLRLSVQRLRTLQQKKEAQAKAARRDIASLIERGKVETARIKVEGLINEDIYVELLELLELYCELLLARFGLLDQNTREPDVGVGEGICAIVYAAPRTELKELHILRDILMHKHGREFSIAVMENRDGCVSDRVVRKLVSAAPSTDLVDAYIGEIAKAYGVEWSPPEKADADSSPATGGGDKDPANATDTQDADMKVPDLSAEAAEGRDLKLPNVPPANDKEKGKDAAGDAKSNEKAAPTTKAAAEADDFEALAARFAALKKR